jgi:hypothetical protein
MRLLLTASREREVDRNKSYRISSPAHGDDFFSIIPSCPDWSAGNSGPPGNSTVRAKKISVDHDVEDLVKEVEWRHHDGPRVPVVSGDIHTSYSSDAEKNWQGSLPE